MRRRWSVRVDRTVWCLGLVVGDQYLHLCPFPGVQVRVERAATVRRRELRTQILSAALRRLEVLEDRDPAAAPAPILPLPSHWA